jgi:hypothetical protein
MARGFSYSGFKLFPPTNKDIMLIKYKTRMVKIKQKGGYIAIS